MNFYQRFIFPWICDWAMGQTWLIPYRKQTLSEASGNILEIGIGTGRNLSCYPSQVKHLSALDLHSCLHRLARRRMTETHIQIDYYPVTKTRLPFGNQRFDCVVSTCTLCSIEEVDPALDEIRRVLKPQGKLLFLEHGLSPEAKIASWQHRLTPVWKRVAGGCHLDRDIPSLLEKRGFRMSQLNQFYLEQVPKFLGYASQGVAIPVSGKGI